MSYPMARTDRKFRVRLQKICSAATGGTVVEGAVVEGAVVEGAVVEGAVVEGGVDGRWFTVGAPP
jgi:hypothetical protein